MTFDIFVKNNLYCKTINKYIVLTQFCKCMILVLTLNIQCNLDAVISNHFELGCHSNEIDQKRIHKQ